MNISPPSIINLATALFQAILLLLLKATVVVNACQTLNQLLLKQSKTQTFPWSYVVLHGSDEMQSRPSNPFSQNLKNAPSL